MMSELTWQTWRAKREAAARARDGWLALTGTHWIFEETVIPGLPGVWRPDGSGDVELKAAAADGLTLDTPPAASPAASPADGAVPGRRPVDGTVTLAPGSSLWYGDVWILVVLRQGTLAVRTHDPAAPRLLAFERIDAFPYDPAWVLPAMFRPYENDRPEAVPRAGGGETELVLAGEVTIGLPEGPHTIVVERTRDGLSAVIADQTSGDSTYRFRTLPLPAPDTSGALLADFNRVYLPPCAFADSFVCPYPPAGNRFPVAVTAGEKGVVSRG
jgi:uncharacterized protein